MKLPTLLLLTAIVLLNARGTVAQTVTPGVPASPGASLPPPPPPKIKQVHKHPAVVPTTAPEPTNQGGQPNKGKDARNPRGGGNANSNGNGNGNGNANRPNNPNAKPPRTSPPDPKVIEEARRRWGEAVHRYHRERHDRSWWKQHYTVVVLVLGGYYYWDGGYWYPAWGYDTTYENYDYDGPIYTYGNLLPDQVVINVQHALKELGYYNGDVTGSLGPSTRQAINAFQNDNGLDVTGTVDEATVIALGLLD